MNRLLKGLNFIRVSLKKGFERFPVTIALAIAFVIVAIYYNHADLKDYGSKLLMGIAIGVPTAGCLHMVAERRPLKRWVIIFSSLVVVALAIVIIPENPMDVFVKGYFALTTALYALFFIIPYVQSKRRFSRYIFFNIGKFFLTVLYVLILFAGVSATYFTIDVLFELNLSDEIFFDLFLISAGIFGVMHFLGHMPSGDHGELSYTPLFERLFTWIILPLMTIYTLILHAYFIKILFVRQMPEGMIGNLVVWYGLIGVVMLFFLNEISPAQPWVQRLRVWFPVGMVIPMMMLFIAISTRIAIYGLTLSRYLVVVAGLFIIASMVLMTLKRQTANFWITVLGTALVLVSFIGPISGDALTLNNQNRLLEALLSTYQAVDSDGQVNAEALSDTQKAEVNRMATYIVNTYGFDALYLAEQGETAEDFEARTGLTLDYYRYGNDTNVTYDRLYDEALMNVIDVSGDDYLIRISSYDYNERVIAQENLKVSLDMEQILVLKGKQAVSKLDLAPLIIKAVTEKQSPSPQSLMVGDQEYEITLQPYNAEVETRDGVTALQFWEGYLLIKRLN